VVIVVLQSLAWLALPRLVPEAAFYGIVVGIFGGGLVAARGIEGLRVDEKPYSPIVIPANTTRTHYQVSNRIASGGL
jgi:hypothetical protein